MSSMISISKPRQSVCSLFFVFVFVAAVLIASGTTHGDAQVITPYSMDVYGEVRGAMAGDTITVYDGSGALRGKFVLTRANDYGFLHVYGEPAMQGAELTFKLNGQAIFPESGQAVHWLGDGSRVKVDFIRR